MLAMIRILASLAVLLPAAPLALAEEDLGGRLSALREETGAAAIAALLLENGEVREVAAVGERIHGSGVPVEAGDIWHVGSITKSMTATLLARLVEAGEMRWDMSVTGELGEEIDGIDPAWSQVTFEHLLSHRAGLRPNISIMQTLRFDAGSETPRADRIAYSALLLRSPPEAGPGERYTYSNAGYVVAAAMIETAMDETWEALVTREVFEPLGLETAGFGAPGTPGQADQPRGHSAGLFGFGTRAHEPTPRADNPVVLGPAGRVHASLEDLARYGRAHITGLDAQGGEFLTAESLARLHTPPAGDYAMGWVVSPPADLGSPLWHNGSNTLFYTELHIDPEHDRVFAISTNDHDTNAHRAGFREIADWALSLPSD